MAKKKKRFHVVDKARVYGAERSQPGEPPFKQTGHLRRSVASEVLKVDGRLVARVGSVLAKARWLELGTRNMAARPWLRRALLEMKAEVRKILGVV